MSPSKIEELVVIKENRIRLAEIFKSKDDPDSEKEEDTAFKNIEVSCETVETITSSQFSDELFVESDWSDSGDELE